MVSRSEAEHTRPAPDTAQSLRGRLRRNRRWILPVLLMLGSTVAWIDRANLGVAAPSIQGELGISPSEMGYVLSTFAFVLIFMYPFSAWLTDRVGSPRMLYFWSTISWFVFTSAIALARGIVSLFTLRFLLAVGESPTPSAALKATSKWFPRQERGLAIGINEVGSEFGGAIALPLVAALIAGFGWRWSFVLTGLLAIPLALLWLWLYRDPERHPKLTKEEFAHIRDGGGDVGAASLKDPSATAAPKPVAWRTLLRYRTIWGLMAVMFCRTSVIFFFTTWYPTYLVEERGFSLLELGVFGAIPGLVAIVGDLAGGWFSDYLIRRGTDPTTARKLPIVIGLVLGAAIGFAGVADSAAASIALLAVSSAGVAFCTGALYSLPLEVAPSPGNAISISGLMRAGGLTGGFVTPIVVGYLYEYSGTFVLPLVAAGGLLVLTILLLLFMVGKAEPLRVKGAA